MAFKSSFNAQNSMALAERTPTAVSQPCDERPAWGANGMALYKKCGGCGRCGSPWIQVHINSLRVFSPGISGRVQYQLNGMRMTWRRPRILWQYWSLSLIRFVWVDAAALGRTAHFLQQLTFSADCKFFVKKVWRMSPQPVATCTVRCPIV